MKYLTGEFIKVGDKILIEKGTLEAEVELVVDTQELKESIGVDEYGVMLKSEPFGLVFWPINELEDPLIYVSKGKDSFS